MFCIVGLIGWVTLLLVIASSLLKSFVVATLAPIETLDIGDLVRLAFPAERVDFEITCRCRLHVSNLSPKTYIPNFYL